VFYFLSVNVHISAPDLCSISLFTAMQTPSLLGNSRNKEMLCCIKVGLMASHIREFIKVLPTQLSGTDKWHLLDGWLLFLLCWITYWAIYLETIRAVKRCWDKLRLISFFRLPARARRSKRDTLHSWRNFKKRRRNSMNMLKKLWPD